MQVRGTFPELSAGRSKSRPSKAAKRPAAREPKDVPSSGFGGFAVPGRLKRPAPKNPGTFAGRRAASHRKAYPD